MFYARFNFKNSKRIRDFAFTLMFIVSNINIGLSSWLTSSDSLVTLPGEHIDSTADVKDPMEDVNRSVFRFNKFIDRYFAKPVTDIYKEIVPQPARASVHNFVNNINSPIIFINDLLQLEGDRAMDTAARFLINTTLGGLGLFDIANEFFDIHYHEEDFGETLGHYGAGDDYYLVLPFVGPSNPRDLIGIITEFFVDPVDIVIKRRNSNALIYARGALEGIDKRVEADSVLQQIDRSTDPYVAMRSAYTQNRAFNINKGIVDTDSPVPFDDDDDNTK